jgi:chorismate synthase
MEEAIDAARRRGDSLGGVVECVARGVPAVLLEGAARIRFARHGA